MIIEYIRYRLPPNERDAFLEAYKKASASLDASPNCLGYELAQCKEEPFRFILRIHWDSMEGHLQGFRQSDHFQSFFQHVRPFVDAIEEMQHYDATSVVSGI